MTIERRLHHAGRELRGVPIEPPSGRPDGARPVRPVARVLALAAPAVVVGAGLLGALALTDTDPAGPGDDIAAVAVSTNPPARVIGPDHVESAPGVGPSALVAGASTGPARTGADEVAVIAALGGGARHGDRPSGTTPPSNIT